MPGKVEANPYVFYPAQELRSLIKTVTDESELEKIKSALKQWERIYQYPGYPFRAGPLTVLSFRLRELACRAMKLSAIDHPSINLPYEYQDAEVPDGYEGIIEVLTSPHDKYNITPFNYNYQGERPVNDTEFFQGDLTAPKEGIPEVGINPGSSGSDPLELEYPFPPTGGDIDGIL